jgi:hypothetical protein
MAAMIQAQFAEALLDRKMEVPPDLRSWSSARPVRRFEVYRNNVASSLAKALAVRFPATEAIVGKPFFAAMAREYVRERPPRSPVLLDYGDGFADFVRGFTPAAELPYLPDVIRLEDAWMAAYHSADAVPLAPESLAAVDHANLAGVTLALHPSFGLIRSPYPIVTIWAMNSGELPLAEIRHWSAEDALIVRPHLAVLTRRLPPGGATFLDDLAKGNPLGSAVTKAQDDAADFDLTANLVGLFTSGLVIAIEEQADTVV